MAYKLQQNVKRKECTTAELANFTKLILLKIKGRTTFNQPERGARKRKSVSVSGLWGGRRKKVWECAGFSLGVAFVLEICGCAFLCLSDSDSV